MARRRSLQLANDAGPAHFAASGKFDPVVAAARTCASVDRGRVDGYKRSSSSGENTIPAPTPYEREPWLSWRSTSRDDFSRLAFDAWFRGLEGNSLRMYVVCRAPQTRWTQPGGTMQFRKINSEILREGESQEFPSQQWITFHRGCSASFCGKIVSIAFPTRDSSTTTAMECYPCWLWEFLAFPLTEDLLFDLF